MKFLRPAILAAAIALTTPPGVLASPQGIDRTYQVINLMDEYLGFWEMAEALPMGDKIDLFRSSLMANYPELYNPDLIKMMAAEDADERLQKHLASYFEQMQPRLGHVRRLSEQAGADFGQAEAAFLELFNDFSYDGEIYFMPSLLYFDGATRQVKGRTALLLAPDGMSFYHGDDFKVAPLFHHELFHIYQEQFLPEQKVEPLYLSLWREGLAVHAAKTLNPDATPGQLVLMDLMETLPPVLGEVAGHFLSVMDDQSEDWYRVYFSNGEHEFIPKRAGYYLGQLVAQRIARDTSWPQMMTLEGAQLRAEIKSALEALASDQNDIEWME